MKEFFRSKTFKVVMMLLVLLMAFFLRALYAGELTPLIADMGGTVAAPVSGFFNSIGNAVHGFFEPLLHAKELQQENAELKEQVKSLTDKQVDYDEIKNQNELYREFLAISDRNTEYSLEPATVVARPADSRSGAFIINVGSDRGIKAGMPVITDTGLVGIVSQVSYSYSKVNSLLDTTVNVGVLDSATRDTGILSGDVDLAAKSRSRLSYISKESAIAEGDILITSGYGGMIPEGLVAGTVKQVDLDATGLTLTAEVELSAQPDSARRIFVITNYTQKEPADSGSSSGGSAAGG